MGDFNALNTARSGILAHRKAIEVIGNNIANVNTPGYTRRSIDLAPAGKGGASAVWARSDQAGYGVEVNAIRRIQDELADQRVRTELSNDSLAQKSKALMTSLENLFGEPSSEGLNARLTKFFNSWDDAAAQPGNVAIRQALLESANSMIGDLRQKATMIDNYRTTVVGSFDASITQVNADAKAVADLNMAIRAGYANGTGSVADLQDQRDQIIERMVRMTGATARPGDAGTVDVFLGGGTLVRNGNADSLKVMRTGALDPPFDNMGMDRFEVRWSSDSNPVINLGGEFAATTTMVNSTIPRYAHELDNVASQLVTQINALHSSGHGLNVTADVNLNFFDPANTRATNISLSADIAGQPSRIALGAAGTGQLDSSIGHAIAKLTDDPNGPVSTYRNAISSLAVETAAARSRAEVQGKMADQVMAERRQINGVNLDEELSNLIQSQRAYQASARLLTTVDEMLDTLIHRTGTVGR